MDLEDYSVDSKVSNVFYILQNKNTYIYEEAREVIVRKAIELVKQKNQIKL